MKKILSLVILAVVLAVTCTVALSGCNNNKSTGAGGSNITGSGNPNTGLIESRYDNSDYNKDNVSNSVSNFGEENESSSSAAESQDTSSNAASSGINIGENIFEDNFN